MAANPGTLLVVTNIGLWLPIPDGPRPRILTSWAIPRAAAPILPFVNQ